jgi:ATP-dependent Lon protease
MDLNNKNNNTLPRSDSFSSKNNKKDNKKDNKKNKKNKKNIKKELKEDFIYYLESKDPLPININAEEINKMDDYFFSNIFINEEEPIVNKTKNNFILNNSSDVFENVHKKQKKNIDMVTYPVEDIESIYDINDANYIEDISNIKGTKDIKDIKDVNTIKNINVIENPKDNKKNNDKKGKMKFKFDEINDLKDRMNNVTEYNCIKTSFKTTGENLINNEINKKYKKKEKENTAISDKIRDVFKKLVIKDIKTRPNLSEILLRSDFNDETRIRLIKKYIKYSSEDDYFSDQVDKLKYEIENIMENKEDIIIDDNEELNNKIKEKYMPNDLRKRLNGFGMRLHSNSSSKLQNFVNDVLKLPYNKKTSILDEIKDDDESKKIFIKSIYEKLNDKLFGLENVKNSILSYFCLKLNNSQSINKKYLCLCGPPGVGKTSIVQSLSESINIPHSYISMANINDSSILLGHSYTFEGSIYGSLSSSLINNGCKNGIIIFDELDKCGEKVQKNMLGIFDPLQNNKFRDAYFGEFYLDLSETTMIICVNSLAEINPYLRDRLHVVNIDGYSMKEKKVIANDYLIPKLKIEYNIDIEIDSDVIQYILNYNCNEQGIRKINTDLSKIYELAIVDKFMNNVGLEGKFTMKNIHKLNLEVSNDNKHRDSMYN